MSIEFKFLQKESYLLATITDPVINFQRAVSIFKSIADECKKLNCQKVLLHELALKKREIENHEIRKISQHLPNVKLAFLCRPELIDNTSKLLSVFTFTNGYTMKHFSAKDEALNWLLSTSKR